MHLVICTETQIWSKAQKKVPQAGYAKTSWGMRLYWRNVLESLPLIKQPVKHFPDAVRYYGIQHCLCYMYQKLQTDHLLSERRIGDHGGDRHILQRGIDYFKRFSLKKDFTADIMREETKE